MNNRNTAIVVVAILIATAAICFAVTKSNNAPVEAAATTDAAVVTETTPAVASPENPAVAKVDGVDVLRSEVVEFMKNFPPQMQQMPVETLFPLALEQLVMAKIIDAKAAKMAGLANDAEVLKREADAKVQIMRAVYLEKEIEKAVTDDRLKKAYDTFSAEQSKIQEVNARHILVAKEDDAKKIITKIAAGEKFEDLAKAHSTDKSNSENGGDLGYFTKEMMVKEFAEEAFSLNKGDVSKAPVKTQFGYHVVQVLDKRSRQVPSFEEMKESLAVEARKEILNELVEKWRKSADVETFDIHGNKPGQAAPEAVAPATQSAE